MTSINLNQHYTTNTKVEKPRNVIVSGPQTLPSMHVFNDNDANTKFEIVNKELNYKSKKEKNKAFRDFAKVFGIIVLGILSILGIKKILK